MSKSELSPLKLHCEAAEREIRTGGDARLAELVANLQNYLGAVWQHKVDDEQSEKAAVRLLAAANFACDRLVSGSLVQWLAGCLGPPLQSFLNHVAGERADMPLFCRRPAAGESGDTSSVHFFEHVLQKIDPGQRRRVGVFYTPRPVVRYIVSHVHRSLQYELNLADGLADVACWEQVVGNGDALAADPFVQVLDPAVGTGVFLVEVIDAIHQTLVQKWRNQGLAEIDVRQRWNQYVPKHLLRRLTGIELMPAPCLLAALNMTLKLIETGYDFEEPASIDLHVADSLAGPFQPSGAYDELLSDWQPAVRQAFEACQDSQPTVVIGNPPYAALSNSSSPWIEDLIRGRLPGGASTGSYYEVDGRPLKERKLWLHDDYVKFMRFGQWKIEQAGTGILGFVTNHGFLDNPTFRGMRQQLLGAFDSISLADLHGNAKKKETSIDGRPDQNVFDVEQGVTVGLFRKTQGRDAMAQIDYEDVWGSREEKYRWLEHESAAIARPREDGGSTTNESLSPTAPYYFFVPRDLSHDTEYEAGVAITEVMPVSSSAVVTARDSFVIAFQREELVERIAQFRDLAIADDVIRQRYFSNTRSRKYPPGDTRGWKLAEARRRVAADENWESRIRQCLYRPFDKRFIFWSADMVDWPRQEVSRHFVGHENLALIARRQMLPTQPCRYFWVTDDLVLDGVIRSDNRGNETVFPLYLHNERRKVNLNSKFVARLAQQLEMTWAENGHGDVRSTFGPEDVLHFIYATFHSSEYRERYANQLRVEFPRVFFPRTAATFRGLCRLGRQLVKSHLVCHIGQQSTGETSYPGGFKESSVAGGYPKYEDERVRINASTCFEGITQSVWDFHAGGHQVCRKWLKDRRGRWLTVGERQAYHQIVSSIGQTLGATEQVDKQISRAGGWPNAFVLKRIP